MDTITVQGISINISELIKSAAQAMEHAYIPYSHFPVGATVVDNNGTFYSGANIENVSFGLTSCAERNAIFNATTQGVRSVIAICVIANTDDYISPCGACRQVLREFATTDTKILLCNKHKEVKYMTMEELLPFSFGNDALPSE